MKSDTVLLGFSLGLAKSILIKHSFFCIVAPEEKTDLDPELL